MVSLRMAGVARQSVAAALAMAAMNAGAAKPSLCSRLADAAQRLPDAAWAEREPLKRWMQLEAPWPRPPLSATEQAVLSEPRWREALGAGPEQLLGITRLAGTAVYRLDHVAGTANCQSVLLLEAQPGKPARLLPPPPWLGNEALCGTQSARFARVLGQPVLMVGGLVSMISLDRRYRMAAWTGGSWGPSCTLNLHLRPRLEISAEHCAPGAEICQSSQAMALRLAQAYEADRNGGAPLDAAAFQQGREPDEAVSSALLAPPQGAGALGDERLQWFGADGPGSNPFDSFYSNVDRRLLAVWADGRWWLAVVGRAGLGWREAPSTLVTLFAPPGHASDAVAGYRFKIVASGLLIASTSEKQKAR